MAAPQQAIDNIWEKYRTALKALEDSLDENNVLGIKNKQALDEHELLKQKLKDAGIDWQSPADIIELEKRLEARLAKNG
jgi:hypothetical protein